MMNNSLVTRRDFLRLSAITGAGLAAALNGKFCKPVASVDCGKPTIEKILVGLEIGTSKICVLVGGLKRDGSIKILGVGQAPSRGVRKGEIVDFDTAQKCVLEALANAEVMRDVMIRRVYLGITGASFSSFNNRGSVLIPENQDKITESECYKARCNARARPIPREDMFLHSIPRNYYVDGQESVLDPVGMTGRRLDADFHIIHGGSAQIKNAVRCVKKIPAEMEDVVFNPFASAKAVLNANQRKLGALVIDIGGGTTDYLVYVDGAVCQSGSLAIGGDHITHDLGIGLRIPMARAEKLKIEEGSARVGMEPPGETVTLASDSDFAGKVVKRETLNTIIHMRMHETFDILKRRLEIGGVRLDSLGAGVQLTGGCSRMRGIDELAGEVFGIPARLARVKGVSGPASVLEYPGFACAIGLVKYSHESIS